MADNTIPGTVEPVASSVWQKTRKTTDTSRIALESDNERRDARVVGVHRQRVRGHGAIDRLKVDRELNRRVRRGAVLPQQPVEFNARDAELLITRPCG